MLREKISNILREIRILDFDGITIPVATDKIIDLIAESLPSCSKKLKLSAKEKYIWLTAIQEVIEMLGREK